MSNQNYESHMQMIDELQSTLSKLNTKMSDLKKKYKKQIDIMHSATFMDNYITPLRERYSAFAKIIDTLQEMINEHKIQIKKHEAKLEHIIKDAKGLK